MKRITVTLISVIFFISLSACQQTTSDDTSKINEAVDKIKLKIQESFSAEKDKS